MLVVCCRVCCTDVRIVGWNQVVDNVYVLTLMFNRNDNNKNAQNVYTMNGQFFYVYFYIKTPNCI